MSTTPVSCSINEPPEAAGLLALAQDHGLKLGPASLRLNLSGLDFLVGYARDRAGQDWVLRMPRRPDVIASAVREGVMLAALRPSLAIALPDWRIHSDALIAYPRLPGEPAGVIDASLPGYVWAIDAQNLPEAFVHSTARALAALHRLDPNLLSGTGAPRREIATVRADFARDIAITRELLQVPDTVLARWQAWLADDAYWPTQAAVLHGDLHPGHLLIDETGQLTGILDWTEAAVGDPSLDLTAWLGCFGETALDQLLAAYATAGGPVWPGLKAHIQMRWSAQPVGFAVFAQTSGVHDYLPVAQHMLEAQEEGSRE